MSYGKIGSNPISPYQSLALMTPIRYNFNDEIITGFFESNLANDDLTWETTDQFNFGIDIGFTWFLTCQGPKIMIFILILCGFLGVQVLKILIFILALHGF